MHSVKPSGALWRSSPNRFSIQKQSRWLLLLEKTFVVFSILVLSRALLFSLPDAGNTGSVAMLSGNGDAPSVISQPKLFWLYLCIYIGTGLVVLPHLRQVTGALFSEKYVLLLLLLAALSILWSTDPEETLVKSIALGACTVFGVYVAVRYSIWQQMQLLAVAFSMIMLASIIVANYFPGIGVMHGLHEGIWRGVFLHKNALGTYMFLAGIVFFLLLTAVSRYRFFYHAAFWLALLLLILSCAKSSLLSWVILFSALGVYFARIHRPRVAVIAIVSVVLALCGFVMQYKYKVMPPIMLAKVSTSITKSSFGLSSAWAHVVADFEAAQRNAPPSAFLATGSGRLRLWGHLWEKIQERPWLGYGVGGFWRGMQGPSADIWKLEQWRPPGAHNSFIDLWLDLGVIGLGLLTLSISAAIIGSVAPIIKGSFDLHLLFPLAVLIGLCLVKIGEGGLFGANILTWTLFVTAVINVHESVRQRGEYPLSPSLPNRLSGLR